MRGIGLRRLKRIIGLIYPILLHWLRVEASLKHQPNYESKIIFIWTSFLNMQEAYNVSAGR